MINLCHRFGFAQDAIEKEDFGLDLPSAQKYQQNHHVQHDAVLAFQDELDKIKKLEVRFARNFNRIKYCTKNLKSKTVCCAKINGRVECINSSN